MDNVYARSLVRLSRDIWLEFGVDIAIENIKCLHYKPFGISRDIPCAFIVDDRYDMVINDVTFRPLIRYPGYAVSQNAIVYSYARKSYIQPCVGAYYGYASVRLLDYLRWQGKETQVSLHKLVAMAWVSNNDYVNKNVVDHIDEDKLNNNASNLQWISNATNQVKSVYRTVGNNIIVRNIRTGEISIVPGTNAAFRIIGRSQGDSTVYTIAPGKIFRGKNGIYEMKYDRDDTPWVYGPDKIPSEQEIRSKPRTQRHGYTYEVLDTKTKKVIACNSAVDVHKHIPSVSISAIMRHIYRLCKDPNNVKYLIANRYLLRVQGTNTPWPRHRVHPQNAPKQVTIDGVTYDSIREASRSLGLDQKTIKRIANNKS